MTSGKLLSDSLAIWAKNFVPFTILGTVVYLPLIAYTLVFLSDIESAVERDFIVFGIGLAVGAFVLGLILTGAIAYGVFQQLRGRPAPLAQCVSVGLSRLLPVLGVGLLAALAVIGGFMLFVIPGIIASLMLFLAVPVAVIENPGPIESLRRSAKLMEGYKLVVFGALFLIGFVDRLFDKGLEAALLGEGADFDSVRLYFLLLLASAIIVGTLQSVMNAVAYHEVRSATDGTDVEELAAVFD